MEEGEEGLSVGLLAIVLQKPVLLVHGHPRPHGGEEVVPLLVGDKVDHEHLGCRVSFCDVKSLPAIVIVSGLFEGVKQDDSSDGDGDGKSEIAEAPHHDVRDEQGAKDGSDLSDGDGAKDNDCAVVDDVPVQFEQVGAIEDGIAGRKVIVVADVFITGQLEAMVGGGHQRNHSVSDHSAQLIIVFLWVVGFGHSAFFLDFY